MNIDRENYNALQNRGIYYESTAKYKVVNKQYSNC